jgi:hypothetical protein
MSDYIAQIIGGPHVSSLRKTRLIGSRPLLVDFAKAMHMHVALRPVSDNKIILASS